MKLKEGNLIIMKKFFINILIMFITIMLGLGGTCVQAMQDYQGSKAKTLRLSYFRYINGGYTNGYALNTVGNEGESHHPIYQIMWILDNMYVAGQTQGTSQKQELLAKAGIVFGNVDDEDAQGNVKQGYRYIAQPGYDYSSKVSTQGKKVTSIMIRAVITILSNYQMI